MNSSDIRNLLDSEEALLLDAYEETLNRVRKRLLEQEIRGLSTKHTLAAIRDIEAITEELREYHYNWLIRNVPLAYEEGSMSAVEKLTNKYKGYTAIDGDYINMSFGAVHQEAARVIIKDTFRDVAGLTQNMTDSAKEILRNASKEIFQPALIAGEKRVDVTKTLIGDLNKNREGWTVYYDDKGRYIPLKEYVNIQLDENWVGFIDKAGRQWDPMHYSKMLTRTKLLEASNVGTENRLVANKLDLVIITAHGAEDWCRFYENRVFSISGQSSEYPSLKSAPNGGCPFHPLCKHNEAPFIAKFEKAEVVQYGKELGDEFRGLNVEGTGYADQAKLRALEKKYPIEKRAA
jgi:hypothetical protein